MSRSETPLGIEARAIELLISCYDRHSEAEGEQLDLDKTMQTVAESPSYEHWPRGYSIVGRDAVRELYRRILKDFLPRVVGGVEVRKSFGEDHLTVEHKISVRGFDNDVREVRALTVLLVEASTGRVAGEHVYMDDLMAELVDDALGVDFVRTPGVSRLYPVS